MSQFARLDEHAKDFCPPTDGCLGHFLKCNNLCDAQKQLIVGRRSFHFAVNRISYLEGVGWRGFWATPNPDKPVLRNAPLKKQFFSPESRLVARAATLPFGA
jgi:hypothetical protein